MKKSKFLTLAFCVLGLSSCLFSSCDDKYELYEIDAPENLKDKIDSIAAANNPQRGDTLKLDILTAIVGAEDNSAGWWSQFSDYFTIPTNRLLHLEFVNYGTGANNWNNWNLCLCNGERDGDGYSEYFVLRSDMYGWGNADYSGAMIGSDYAETLIGDDMWAVFREKMQGAYVTMEVDHSKTGNAFVTVKHEAKDGTIFTQTYQQPVSATADINAFLICDGSHFVMKDAYTITSKIQEVEDQPAISISVVGQPESIEIGNEDFWGNAVATVTFADGSSAVAEFDDLSFTVPDLNTVGTKTILYSYSKTKQGNYGPAVAGYYTLEVTNSISALEISTLPVRDTYYFYGDVICPVFTDGMEVIATYVDGSTGIVPISNLIISTLDPIAGQQDVVVAYESGSGRVETSYTVDVIEGTGIVGAPDFSNGWWTSFTEPDAVIAAGDSYTFKLTLLSDNLANYHSPCTILRGAALNEYAVVREDHFGWGSGYDGIAVGESNWDWDTFAGSLNGQEIEITVTNNGDDTANVYYKVIYTNGEEHFQSYTGIAINSADLQTALVTEESCLILHN